MSVLLGPISLTIVKERVPVSLGQRYSFLGNISKPLWSAMIVPSSEVQWKLNVVSLILALTIAHLIFKHGIWSQLGIGLNLILVFLNKKEQPSTKGYRRSICRVKSLSILSIICVLDFCYCVSLWINYKVYMVDKWRGLSFH